MLDEGKITCRLERHFKKAIGIPRHAIIFNKLTHDGVNVYHRRGRVTNCQKKVLKTIW